MHRADRRHGDDLPLNQLDPVAIVQDAGRRHAVVLADTQPARRVIQG